MTFKMPRSLMTAVSVVAFAALLSSCGGSGSGDPVAAAPPLAELVIVQRAAATAATDAQTAATAAKTAADAAEMARKNRAVIQTGDFLDGDSGKLAVKAQEHATAAQIAANAAKAASDTAADADATVSSATRALVMAEGAQDTAEDQQMYAETARDDAVTAAAGEIKIVEKTKTVGDTSITIDGKSQTASTNGVTRNTGLQIDLKITNPAADAPVPGTPEMQVDNVVTVDAIPGYAGRLVEIGFTYDSANDDARVTLVDSYAGTKMVTAFEPVSGGTASGTKENTVTLDDDITLPLTKASGTFLLSSGLTESGSIAAEAMPVTVYYYEVDDEKTYVISNGSTVSGDVTTYMYTEVDIRAGATIPAAVEYSHLHFGVWAGPEWKR